MDREVVKLCPERHVSAEICGRESTRCIYTSSCPFQIFFHCPNTDIAAHIRRCSHSGWGAAVLFNNIKLSTNATILITFGSSSVVLSVALTKDVYQFMDNNQRRLVFGSSKKRFHVPLSDRFEDAFTEYQCGAASNFLDYSTNRTKWFVYFRGVTFAIPLRPFLRRNLRRSHLSVLQEQHVYRVWSRKPWLCAHWKLFDFYLIVQKLLQAISDSHTLMVTMEKRLCCSQSTASCLLMGILPCLAHWGAMVAARARCHLKSLIRLSAVLNQQILQRIPDLTNTCTV